MSKKSFSTWFFENLKVDRMPVPGEIRSLFGPYHVINVSDEYIPANHHASMRACANHEEIYHHWFPLNECVGHMGLNSLFGALCVLHEAEARNAQVLLHCHAGVNRSQMVRSAYYFMRTGRHLHEQEMMRGVVANFGTDPGEETSPEFTNAKPNMLLVNCQRGLLPAQLQMEKFLKLLGTKLEETSTMAASRGGLLTQLKLDTGLQ